MKYNLLIIVTLLAAIILPVNAQTVPLSKELKKETFKFAQKDTTSLSLDVYTPLSPAITKRPCVLFVFGGGFISGQRDHPDYNNYFNTLTAHGYDVVSISYRLGMKGVRHLSIFNTAPIKRTIDMAVEDLFDATVWVLHHADSLGIDTSKLIISGTSAGAITVLQADYERSNKSKLSTRLPQNFRYAGVISFAGAIFSTHGSPVYKTPPAPTLLFHGTRDNLVSYDKRRFFNIGLFGSSYLAKLFRTKGYPYCIYSVEGMGHEVALSPMNENAREIFYFIDQYINRRNPYQMDILFKDPNLKPTWKTITPEKMYKDK
jgi:predicted esterase